MHKKEILPFFLRPPSATRRDPRAHPCRRGHDDLRSADRTRVAIGDTKGSEQEGRQELYRASRYRADATFA